jgi:hypothetical protein
LLEIKGVPSRLAGMVSYCFQDKNGFNLRTALDDTLRHRYGLTILAQGKLIQMNDSDAKSFPAIADWIEETL